MNRINEFQINNLEFGLSTPPFSPIQHIQQPAPPILHSPLPPLSTQPKDMTPSIQSSPFLATSQKFSTPDLYIEAP